VDSKTRATLAEVLASAETEIVTQWLELHAKTARRQSQAETQDTARRAKEFTNLLRAGVQSGDSEVTGSSWAPMRDFLSDLSAARAKAGYSSIDTASFIFSFKEPLFAALQSHTPPGASTDTGDLSGITMTATQLIDRLGLMTVEAFQRTREDVIARQQQEMLELSTPVVRLWENILALPLIGTLDSARTQIVMQNLLEAIVATRSDYAIIDITGVPVVDTLVAQHLLKTVAAARLMGADCMISGIRPQIAQTIIHLGVDLSEVTTKATLADAFAVALRRSGFQMVKQATRDEKRTGSGDR
jgi:rsbT co-antagonist protein RsbR